VGSTRLRNVNRLLSPSYTFRARWDRTDPRQLEVRKDVALTREQWLADEDRRGLGPVPDTFDLWIQRGDERRGRTYANRRRDSGRAASDGTVTEGMREE